MSLLKSGDPAPDSGTSSTDVDSRAEQLVKRNMMIAAAVGLVPVPLVGLVAGTAAQIRMLSQLAGLYEVEFSDQMVQSAVGSLIGAGSSVLASTASRRLILRFIPVVGWAANAVTGAVFAGASTFAVGKVFIQHFASGGTFLTFDPEKVREYYAQQFERGTVEVHQSFAGVKP